MIFDRPDTPQLLAMAERLDFAEGLGRANYAALIILAARAPARWHRDAATAELERRWRLS